MLRKKRRLREVLHRIVQRLCKGLDERSAAGGAGLVELHRIDRVILDFDAFHILSADVENTVHIRVEEGRRIVVCDGLDFALVQHQSRLDQRLAVAGGAGIDNMGILRQPVIDLLNRTDSRLQRAAIVVAVKRVQEGAVLRDERRFCCCGSGIDAEEAVSTVGLQILRRHVVLILPFDEVVIFILRGKERLHARNLELDLNAVRQFLLQLTQQAVGVLIRNRLTILIKLLSKLFVLL